MANLAAALRLIGLNDNAIKRIEEVAARESSMKIVSDKKLDTKQIDDQRFIGNKRKFQELVKSGKPSEALKFAKSLGYDKKTYNRLISQTVSDDEMDYAMNLAAGTLGGESWLGKSAGRINSARAAEMEAARLAAKPSTKPTTKSNPLLQELADWREEVSIARNELERFIRANGYVDMEEAMLNDPDIIRELRRDYKHAVRMESKIRKKLMGDK